MAGFGRGSAATGFGWEPANYSHSPFQKDDKVSASPGAGKLAEEAVDPLRTPGPWGLDFRGGLPKAHKSRLEYGQERERGEEFVRGGIDKYRDKALDYLESFEGDRLEGGEDFYDPLMAQQLREGELQRRFESAAADREIGHLKADAEVIRPYMRRQQRREQRQLGDELADRGHFGVQSGVRKTHLKDMAYDQAFDRQRFESSLARDISERRHQQNLLEQQGLAGMAEAWRKGAGRESDRQLQLIDMVLGSLH